MDVHLILRKDVKGLGQAGDIVMVPAIFDDSYDATKIPSATKKDRLTKASTPAVTAASLSSVKELKFKRPVISRGENRIFGSVSLDDIIASLKTDHGLTIERSAVSLGLGSKIKELGIHPVTIAVGQAKVTLDVVVESD
ncbi:hypothetical protein HDU96_004484 [Phlyctochytrium bullatum]|nr:hypothetical protein HDU96_004484 [Phlyctochytrium bullatum]